MFDRYSASLFESLPNLADIDSNECKRWLTSAYLYCIEKGFSSLQHSYLVQDTFNNLRRLGNALESAAVFDDNIPHNTKIASAFISAESLSLLAKFYKESILESGLGEFLLAEEYIYTKVESALLYLIAGYDSNAYTEIKDVQDILESRPHEHIDSLIIIGNQVLKLITLLCRFELWNMPQQLNIEYESRGGDPLSELINKNQFNMYKLIENSLYSYIHWIIGLDNNGYDESQRILDRAIHLSSSEKLACYSTIYHLSMLLKVTFNETSRRAVVHSVPISPSWGAEYTNYLKSRARGNRMLRSRPFLWPSTIQFVNETLPGPRCHSVVSMPTGSGKSFVAELAIMQALYTGWVLYLAPTNALTHQIQRDLREGLYSVDNLEIRSFVGEEEYTTLHYEIPELIDDLDTKFIAVMTPEKCSLALRLTPELFANCSLCVFDEFHLISESERGIISDLVLGQIISLSSTVRFLLMSAMISNPEDIADWLQDKTGIVSSIPTVKWKPTRTLRGAVAIDLQEDMNLYHDAVEWLEHMPNRVNKKYNISPQIIYCLTGIWQTDDINNYGLMNLEGIATQLQATRVRDARGRLVRYEKQHPSWTNNTSKLLGDYFARNNIPSIVFFPHDKNHVFSVGGIDLSHDSPNIPTLINDYITISERELGITSQVGVLLNQQRVSVHSSAMLESEKEASEEAFRTGVSKLMFATGTLAQGLNLPAVAVIIAGESVGDRRETGTIENDRRSRATILNAIGRAGRAGFSNQSISLIVPEVPFILSGSSDWELVRSTLSVLSDHDASIRVESPLEDFLDRVMRQSFDPSYASKNELLLVSYLSDVEGQQDMKQGILNNTYAAYRRRNIISADTIEQASEFVEQIRKTFIDDNNAPEWIIGVARKAGVDFFTALGFYETMQDMDLDQVEIIDYSVDDWLWYYFKCLRELHPKYLVSLFPEYQSTRDTSVNHIHKFIVSNVDDDVVDYPDNWDELWEDFYELVRDYMNGATLRELASSLLLEEVTDFQRSAGKPIPTIIAVINGPITKLSLFAGLFVAIIENQFSEIGIELPWNLGALPLAIKNGCSDYSSLSWFRFGIRYRICAHLLARAFPLNDLDFDDTQARYFVRRRRSEWLEGSDGANVLTTDDRESLEALRRIVARRRM